MMLFVDSDIACVYGETEAVMVAVLVNLFSTSEPVQMDGQNWWRVTRKSVTDRMACWSDHNRNGRVIRSLVEHELLLSTRVMGDPANYYRLNENNANVISCVQKCTDISPLIYNKSILLSLRKDLLYNNTYNDQALKNKEKRGVEKKTMHKNKTPDYVRDMDIDDLPSPLVEAKSNPEFMAAWRGHLDIRDGKKKPLSTPRAISLSVRKLSYYKATDGSAQPRSVGEMIAMLDAAILGGWTSFFDLSSADSFKFRTVEVVPLPGSRATKAKKGGSRWGR